MSDDKHMVIVIDGECGLCTKFGAWYHKVAPFGGQVVTARSQAGRRLMKAAGQDPMSPQTIVVQCSKHLHTGSDGVLCAMRRAKMPYRLMALALALPKPLRERIYYAVADNRDRLKW